MNPKFHREICAKGEKANSLIREGRHRDALEALSEIRQDLEKQGQFDSYITGKVTLGLLRCHIKLGNFKTAFEIWNADLESSLHGVGIYALESAQTTVQDMLTYDMICAFLHTLSDSEKPAAATAVNQYLSRVCEHAAENGDRAIMRMALSNWKQHLREIYGSAIPHSSAKSLIRYEQDFGEIVKPDTISFPDPTSWERPMDFLEMSSFIDTKTLKKRRSGKKSKAS